MEEFKSTAGQGLGTAGLILGILAIPLGIIPCTFVLGIIFGLGGVVLSIVALTQANRYNSPKALIIAALTCSILGFSFAAAWTIAFSNRSSFIRRAIEDIHDGRSLDEIFEERERDIVLPELENDTITEDYTPESLKALEDTLRKLEGETP